MAESTSKLSPTLYNREENSEFRLFALFHSTTAPFISQFSILHAWCLRWWWWELSSSWSHFGFETDSAKFSKYAFLQSIYGPRIAHT
jgi:hypothetical protein